MWTECADGVRGGWPVLPGSLEAEVLGCRCLALEDKQELGETPRWLD